MIPDVETNQFRGKHPEKGGEKTMIYLCRLHVDATQAVGRIPITFQGFDTMSLAFHKIGGLNGSGLLLKRQQLVIEPLFHGGSSDSIKCCPSGAYVSL